MTLVVKYQHWVYKKVCFLYLKMTWLKRGEHWTCKPRVSGLIPGAGNLKKLLIWMKNSRTRTKSYKKRCGWDDNACLGVTNTSSIGAGHNSLDLRLPWYCIVSPQLQNKTKQNWIDFWPKIDTVQGKYYILRKEMWLIHVQGFWLIHNKSADRIGNICLSKF